MMKRAKAWVVGTVVVAMGTYWAVMAYAGPTETAYRFVELSRGSVESTVAATGAVQATETVEVGTQVSGQIAEIFVDFNDRVERGQLLARIDPVLGSLGNRDREGRRPTGQERHDDHANGNHGEDCRGERRPSSGSTLSPCR